MKKYLPLLLRYFAYGLAAIILLVEMVLLGIFGPMPGKKALAAITQESASLIYSEDGMLIGKYFAKNRTQLDSSDVPEYLINGLIATEDKRFYEHNGLDIRSYGRVLVKSILLGGDAGGGSTITQQLAKNLYGRGSYFLLSMPVSKIREAILARRLEKVYTKHQIVVLYFNTVPFGENTWGIEAASQRYFNRKTSELTQPQAALLVGMLKANTAFNPRLYPERAVERRNVVLGLMHEQKMLDDKTFKELSESPLELDYTNYERYNPSGYFVEEVRKQAEKILTDLAANTGQVYDLEKDGLDIYTTLNYRMQTLAVDAVKNHLSDKQKTLDKELTNSAIYKTWKKGNEGLFKDTTKAFRTVFSWDEEPVAMTKADSAWHVYSMLHASVLAVNPKNGEIKVWVGGNNQRYLPYDLVNSKRQAASAFKPILYAAALEHDFTPCTYLSNEENAYPEFDGWRPRNYDNSSGGHVAMWYALAHSMNLPTVDLYMKLGHQNLVRTSNALGLQLPSQKMPALSLGTESFALHQMVRAYGAFANGGYTREMVAIKEITNSKGEVIYKAEEVKPRKALSQYAAGTITDMLIGAVRNGTGRRMITTYGITSTLAGKTGTSQNYSDAWFLCYNQDLVCGVWVGAMSPQVHFRSGGNGSGSSLALPIAGQMLRGVRQNQQLRKQYLRGINRMSIGADSLSCPAYEPEGGFLDFLEGLFDREEPEPAIIEDPENPTSSNDQKKHNTQAEKPKNVFQKIFKKRSVGA